MLAFRIARRFLWRSRGQSALIVAGIALGIGTQVFVGSLINSLQASLLDTTVGSSPHLTLQPVSAGKRLRFDDALARRLADDPSITAIAPQYELSALTETADGELQPLVLKAGELEALDSVYGISDRIVAGEPSLGADSVVLGLEFAEENGISPGDRVRLVLGASTSVEVTVAGIFDLGVAAFNARTGFAGAGLGREALGVSAEQVDLVELQITDVFASGEVASSYADIAGVETLDWQEQNAALLAGLQSQSISSIMIQVFVVVAVALGIASTLAISAVQKTRQIGILKAMGMADLSTGAIFLWQAALLGGIGTLLGIAVGVGLIAGFDAAAAGSDALFPVSVSPEFALLSLGVGLGVALLSAILPYRSTARLDPIAVIQSG
jgi:lipoprotein-releasing system permease protein